MRLPASYCGVYGFKPSYGRISRHGVVAYASSLDTVGIIGGDVGTVARAFDVLKTTGGVSDMTSAQRRQEPIKQDRRIRVGVPQEVLMHLKPPAKKALSSMIDRLMANAGGSVEYVSLSGLNYSLATYYTLAMVEAASCLARYPLGQATSCFGPHVERRVRLGRWMSSHRHGERFFGKALERRREIQAEFAALFSTRFDVIACPTAVDMAPLLEETPKDDPELWSERTWERILESDFSNEHLGELMADLLTVPASLAQIPAISCPVTAECGVQLMTAHFCDEELLQLVERLSPQL